MTTSNPLHSGFSSAEFEPVGQASFYGLRAFLVGVDLDLGAELVAAGDVPDVGDDVGTDHRPQPRPAGVLHGVFMSRFRWGAGDNTALCFAASPLGGKDYRPHGKDGFTDCQCGFWAYTNGDHLLSVAGPAALGIVEGWGRMVVGPDGFRAEKARIVALFFPAVEPDLDVDDDSAGRFTNLMRRVMGTPQDKPGVHPMASVAQVTPHYVPPDVRALVAQRYPRARIFTSLGHMLDEFPTSDLTALLPDEKEDGAA